MKGAFPYLIRQSVRNWSILRLRQLRSPRYLVALVLGLGYLWAVLAQRHSSSPPGGPMPGPWLETLGGLGIAVAVAWSWLFGVERRALAFSPAEVTLLFTAPVTRRWLIQYKLLRNQLLILLNVVLWTALLPGEGGGGSSLRRAVSVWVLLTTLSLHRLGASFVRTSLGEHGRFGLRRRAGSLFLGTTLLLGLAWTTRDAFSALLAGWGRGLGGLITALEAVAASPVPHLLLLPFVTMVRPLTAPSGAAWAHALIPALFFLVAHFVWVVRSDSAFEEAAADASLHRAREIGSRGVAPAVPRLAHRRVPALLTLGPSGWPAGAVLWKNLIAVARTRRAREVTGLFLVAGGAMILITFFGDARLADAVGWLAVMWAGVLVVVGPQWVRNDLRNDLLMLDVLRSYPLRGRSVVAAEVAASSAVLTAAQLGLLGVAYLAFLGSREMELGLLSRTLLLLGTAIYLPGINYAGMLIQNGAALLFPAWVHLGAGRPGGVEALGQSMLMTIVLAAALALVLLAPTLLGAGVFLLLDSLMGLGAIVPATVGFVIVLAGEIAFMVRWLGAILERTEPLTVAFVHALG